METYILSYIYSAISFAFAFYLLWLLLKREKNFKKFLILFAVWALFSHSSILSAVSFPNLSAINNLEVLAFYLLSSFTVFAGYVLTYYIFKYLPIFLKKIESNKFYVWIFVFFLPMAEYLRGFILSLLFWGHNSSLGISDVTFSVANALSMTPLVSLAYFGHIYYLSFVLSIIILFLLYSFRKKAINIKLFIFLFVFFVLQLFYVYFQSLIYQEREQVVGGSNYPDINMLIIPTHLTTHIDTTQIQLQKVYKRLDSENDTRLNHIINNSDKNTDLIILPEAINYKPSLNSRIKYLGPPILQGVVTTNQIATNTNRETPLINASVYIDPASGITMRKKSYLFPFYEYSPYLSPVESASPFIMGTTTPTDFYTDINRVGTSVPHEREKIYRWTTMICSEFFHFDYIKALRNRHYDLIFAQSSFSIFNHSRWMYSSILMSQKINSAYLGIPLIQVSNDGPSFVIKNNKLIYFTEQAGAFTINVDK